MFKRLAIVTATAGLWAAVFAVPAAAQQPPAPAAPQPPQTGRARICDQDIDPPAMLPPAGSGPVVWLIAPCFDAPGGVSLIDPETYLYYIHLMPSRPTQGVW